VGSLQNQTRRPNKPGNGKTQGKPKTYGIKRESTNTNVIQIEEKRRKKIRFHQKCSKRGVQGVISIPNQKTKVESSRQSNVYLGNCSAGNNARSLEWSTWYQKQGSKAAGDGKGERENLV